MKVLFPENDSSDLNVLLQRISSETLLKPFDEVLMRFVKKLSSKILLDKSMRQFPDLMAAAYWMRKEHISKLKEEFQVLFGDRLLFAKGVVLHFAPSNVDTIFIYSWILSLLMGNANIIRLSQKRSNLVRAFFDVLGKLLCENNGVFSSISNRLLVVTYDHSAEITAHLSAHCDVRVIWGGDQTIKKIREIPLPARSDEMVFADRFSAAAINAKHILDTSSGELNKLVELFYQDAFMFNQKACSSPKIVFWIGEDADIAKARQRFWDGLKEYTKNKDLWRNTEIAIAMIRLTSVFKYAALNKVEQVDSGFFDLPCRIRVKHLDDCVRALHSGGGLFLEKTYECLDDLASSFTIKDQTLTVCGFSADEMVGFVKKLPYRSLDRVVPFGEALKFSHVWDGYNLLLSFSREIAVNI